MCGPASHSPREEFELCEQLVQLLQVLPEARSLRLLGTKPLAIVCDDSRRCPGDEVRVRELGLEAGDGCPDGGELLVKTSALLLSVEQAGERHADSSVPENVSRYSLCGSLLERLDDMERPGPGE